MSLFIVAGFLFFYFPSQASAVTVYVSNSTSNGYTTGNNSNTYVQAQSKFSPKLTITGALAVVVSGDTIVINNGTYVEASFLNPSVSNLTINSESDYGVTVQVSGTPTHIFVPGAAGLTIGKLILDGQNIAQDIIYPNAIFSGLTINGTHILNFTTYGVYDVGKMTNLTMAGGWLIETTTSTNYARGIYLTLGNSTNSITNGTINITASSYGVYGINVTSTVSNNNTTIDNVSINLTQTNPANGFSGIFVSGSTSTTISNNNLTISGGSSNDGISVSSSTIQNTHADIHNNIILTTGGTSPGGHGIVIGNDGVTANAGIVGPSVYGNTVTGFNHGMGFFAGVSNGIMSRNIVNKGTNSGGGTIGFILKQSNNNLIASNIVNGGPMTGGSLRAKADTDGSFINNTVIVDTASAVPIYATIDPTNSKSTTNEIFSNNIIYINNGISSNGAIVDSSNTATFSNNDYFGSFSSYPFSYLGVTYTSLSLWKAGVESSAVNFDPSFVSSSDFSLQPTSLAINSGVVVSLTSDYLGNLIVGEHDLGAYEFQISNIPSSLAQYKSDGITVITSGTFTNENSVVFKFNISSVNSSDLLTPQIEIQELATPFTNTLTNSGAAVSYSGTSVEGVVTITGLTSGRTYHWQARVSNPVGQSAWVSLGGNPDFRVDTAPPTNIGISSITADSTSQLTILAQTAIDLDSGLHSTPYWFAETSGNTGSTSSSIYQTSTAYIDTGLSANTLYTYKVRAKDANDNVSDYSTTLSKYTLANTPTNLIATSDYISVSLSVDSFVNDTSGISGYYFSSSSGNNSGWIQNNSWQDTSLSCNTTYTYSVKYRNGDGVETDSISLSKITTGCRGGGIISGWSNKPTTPAKGFQVLVNGGNTGKANIISNRIVNLNFNAGLDIKKMAISLKSDFSDVGQENYQPTKQIDLCSKWGGLIKDKICPDGEYIVYIKFYTEHGIATDVISQKVKLVSVSTQQNKTFYNFGTKTLKNGSKGESVKELQKFLNKVLNLNLVLDGKLGPKTIIVIKKWQKANGLVPDGIIGVKTKAKMNNIK